MLEERNSIDMSQEPEVKGFFDPDTNTVSYVVHDPGSKACAVIDSVMDFDYAAGRIGFKSADRIIEYIGENGLRVEWLIETHAHADHLSAAPYIQEKLGDKIGIGEHIMDVQEVFGKVFNEGTEFRRDGSQFDRLFKDGDTYEIVRRQNIWRNSRRRLAEYGPRLVVDVMRRACGVASADIRWSFA